MTIDNQSSLNLPDELDRVLQDRFAEQYSTQTARLDLYTQLETFHACPRAAAVCEMRSQADVVDVVNLCQSHKVALIAMGARTSLEAQIAPLSGPDVKPSILLDFSAMNQIISVSQADMSCKVEPGVSREQLNQYLRDTGLFFSVDPGANATVGGMVNTRASGTNTVRYGTISDNVLSLSVVTASAQLIKTANAAKKSAAGYDLTHLYIGSEGTLGLVTEVSLKLHPQPESVLALRLNFAELSAAVDTVIMTMQMAIAVARLELLDVMSVQAINAYSDLDLPEQPTLFVEFHGSPLMLQEQLSLFTEIAEEMGGTHIQSAFQEEQRRQLWQARHHAYWAIVQQRPGCQGWSTDVCVPLSNLAECIKQTQVLLASSFLKAPIIGHVGDGNFHVLLVLDSSSEREVNEAERLNATIVDLAQSLNGTCTGEHGVGLGKLAYLPAEHGEALVVMQTIKQALDPKGLFNPGKTIASS